MDWSASLDTAAVVSAAQAATAALSAMKAGIGQAGAALSAMSVGAASKALDTVKAKSSAAAAAVGGPLSAAGKAVSATFDKVVGGASAFGDKVGKVMKGAGKSAGGLTSSLKGALPMMLALAGISGFAGLAKIAIGYRAVGQLQGIAARASFGFSRLFTGVDAKPLIKAADLFSRNFTGATVTGRALGEVLTNAFNAVIGAISAAEPYVTAFTSGIVLGMIYGETAIIELQIALFPLIGALDMGTASAGGLAAATDLGTAAAVALGVGIAVMGGKFVIASARAAVMVGRLAILGVQAAIAAGRFVIMGIASSGAATGLAAMALPVLACVAAFVAVALAIDQAMKLYDEWNDDAGSDMWEKFKQDIGINSADEAMANKGVLTGDAYDKAEAAKAAKAAQSAPAAQVIGPPLPPAKEAGMAAGKAMGQGIVDGMGSTKSAVAAAGALLAKAAESGVKTKAEIHSPSRMMRRSGRHMGEGVALGEEDSADRVNKAAASSLVPDMAKLGGIGGGGRGGASIVGPLVMVDKVIVQSENMASEFRMMLDSEAARIAETLNLVRA